MSDKRLGLMIVGLGLAVAVVGFLVATGALGWFGKLPGDIRIEGEHSRFYFPITSMLLASLVLSLALNLIRRLF